ncbi:BTAD domain-containing putative transcriptional regulator [Nocardiopsis sp. NPDC006139]|uniref:AfsR/SARP family transcriptional regulator n=1 Tax=Nocardiopsis sp. NPDC006139 TaxID=3154578 RepID=UPI00339EE51B
MNPGSGFNGVFFRLLGPLQVEAGSEQVHIPPGRQQVILRALLLEAGRTVSTDHLVDVTWDCDPPDTARTQVQICVSRLRKSLAPLGTPLLTSPPGYLLRVEPEAVDVHLSRILAERAGEAVAGGRPEEAVALLRRAAGLWRGPSLGGPSGRLLRPLADRLDEDRASLVEAYLDLELELGRHDLVVGEIDDLVRRYPLRERLRYQLMLALHRSGRRAEALRVYRRGRELSTAELGREPGPELRALEAAVLAGESPPDPDPAPAAPAAPVAVPAPRSRAGAPCPRQLPADTADFSGRGEQAAALEAALTGPGRGGGRAALCAVVGLPGVGKSALAVHVAHRLARAGFPDGQLYCDLRGGSGTPLDPARALARFLRALGVPDRALPEGLGPRARMYRDLLARRRVLVLLDDAADDRQVADLLPPGPGCAAIVTGRSGLAGIPGADLVELDVLPQDQALELLRRVIGPERTDADPEAAAELLGTVGRLPLALRIVAARLVARPHWSLASMVARLADERHRLDQLSHGGLTVRAGLVPGYEGLAPDARRTLRLFALADGPGQPGWAAGALLDDRRPRPDELLEPLVDARMLAADGTDAAGGPRYRFHDVVRLFARERLAEEETESERREAAARLVGGWLFLAEEADLRTGGGSGRIGAGGRWRPPPADAVLRDPAAWLSADRSRLCAAVDLAADHGLDELCWNLALALVPLFHRRGYLREWDRVNDRAAEAVRAAANRRGAAAVAYSRGCLDLDRRRPADARAAFEEALAVFGELGDVTGRAWCTWGLARLERAAGRREHALELCGRALRDFQEVGDPDGEGRALMLSGHLRTAAGAVDAGEADLARALTLYERTGDPRGRARVLSRMGRMARDLGDERRALRLLTEARELDGGEERVPRTVPGPRDLGDRDGTAARAPEQA